MSRPLVCQLPFPFHVWLHLERNQISANPPAELLLFLTHPLNLFSLLRGRSSLLVVFHFLETCLISLWNPPFPPHAPVSILLFVTKVRLLPLDSISTHNVVTWNGCFVPFLFSCLDIAMSLPLCSFFRFIFYLNLSSRSGRNCLLFHPVPSGLKGSPDTCFSRGTTWLII